jgi:hypothetical protein
LAVATLRHVSDRQHMPARFCAEAEQYYSAAQHKCTACLHRTDDHGRCSAVFLRMLFGSELTAVTSRRELCLSRCGRSTPNSAVPPCTVCIAEVNNAFRPTAENGIFR